MQTQEQQEVKPRPRRAWWIIGLTVLVVALVEVGIWAIIAANQTDDIDVATELVDEWVAAWIDGDLDAVAAVLTEDGVYVGQMVDPRSRDYVMGLTRGHPDYIYRPDRTGDGVAVEADTFSFPLEFASQTVMSGQLKKNAGTVEIELEGDLASRIKILEAVEIEEIEWSDIGETPPP